MNQIFLSQLLKFNFLKRNPIKFRRTSLSKILYRFADMAAILISIVSNDITGCSGGQIDMYLP